MVTTETWGRRSLFQAERWAKLLIDTIYHYRGGAYLLHEFVIMPDHIHLLITPQTSLEKAVQFIKGGFSYRAKKDLSSSMEVWQRGFQDHRIRDANDYLTHVVYIHNNPVRKHFCERPQEFPYSSAHPGFELDSAPQGLKPQSKVDDGGVAEATPLQNSRTQGLKPRSKVDEDGAAKAAPLQSSRNNRSTLTTSDLTEDDIADFPTSHAKGKTA
jgi:putative transposase